MKKKLILLFFSALILTACSNRELLKIENANAYSWQKYMNEEEYEKLEEGMSYMEVVHITGGPASDEKKKKKKLLYTWQDEILLTKKYIITFEKDKLIKKEIQQKKAEEKK